MFIGLLKQFLKKTAVLTAGVSILLAMGLVNVQAAPKPFTCSISPVDGTVAVDVPITFTGSTSGGKGKKTYSWDFTNGVGVPDTSTDTSVDVTYPTAGTFQVLLDVTDKDGVASCSTTVTVTGGGGGNTPPTANPDSYNATIDVTLNVELSSPGVLGNDTDDGLVLPLVANLVSGTANGALLLNTDGSFNYVPNPGFFGTDTFTYNADDGEFQSTATVTITVVDLPPRVFADQTDFKILMNYELGMHCTGFEFAYCCVLPAYNSILAQVVKPQGTDKSDFPELLEGDPNDGLDALGRETVVRDKALNADGNFKKYVLKYWHEAQPRNDGRGKIQTSTLISAAEGNSLLSWNTIFDSAEVIDGALQYGDYDGAQGVLQGNNSLSDPTDNYQNAVWNHLYFYENLEGDNSTGTSLEADKIRLGVSGQPGPFPAVAYPTDCGPAFHPLGPVTTDADGNTIDNTCGGFSNGNVLTFSGHKGTVVFTQMKVLENLPIMLTSPDIWEALGLPLTPFEDSIDFFTDPGLLNEDSVRPFVVMNAQMYDYDPGFIDPVTGLPDPAGAGAATMDSAGNPVIGFGTAPIDIPNCERCHSNPPNGSIIQNAANEGGGELTVVNSPNVDGSLEWTRTQMEYEYWNAYYNIDKAAGDSDWYSRLKSAALSMLTAHDTQHGTSFTANYPGTEAVDVAPQNTRLGHESVICQRCHADNVIASVKSAECGAGNTTPVFDPITGELVNEPCDQGTLIKPITEALHNNHRGVNMMDANGIGGVVTFADSLGRDGGCQGCHPAHRSNGEMDGYPITLAGGNKYAGGDNRGANGGCFVGRDVHSNPGKDTDGVETVAHLNAVGQWLEDNVAHDNGGDNGIWCTNCHNQLGQEIWKAENMVSLVHGVPGKEADLVTDAVNIRALPDLAAIAAAVGTTLDQAESWLDPKEGLNVGDDDSYAIWDIDPGLCDYVDNVLIGGQPANPAHDGNVATIEVHAGGTCSTGYVDGPNLATAFGCNTPATLCGTFDGDGDFSVHAMDFCTTPDCVAVAQAVLDDPNSGAVNALAVPVPMSAATDGRDHWLSPGEPHCADCHAAPFVEQSGNINQYPPFNYPRKASLMRYSRGHQDISCQGCHESIHGLYPVTPNIDTTTYAQAAALNHDGSHGPLKCGTCHEVGGNGIPTWVKDLEYNGQPVRNDFDGAVAWMHTFTAEADPRQDVCLNCHEDYADKISHAHNNKDWIEHADKGRTSRQTMDTVELLQIGHIAGDPAIENPLNTVCVACHGNKSNDVSCDKEWKEHLINGRVAEFVWEDVSLTLTGSTCGW